MKKNIALFIAVISVVGCSQKHFIMTGEKHLHPIEGQYIVIMRDNFEAPLIDARKPSDDRLNQRELNKPSRKIKKVHLKKELNKFGVNSRIKYRFADVKVMAIVHTSEAKADALRADAMRSDGSVEAVIQDITIQINPIQQIPPITNINPIQQSEIEQARLDIDHATMTTKAVLAAGGFKTFTATDRVIWFLDTGLDLNNSNLNVNSSLGENFVGVGLEDVNGHGTFCAGVAAGLPIGSGSTAIHIGVSEGATVVPVKVLDRNGRGSWGSVLAGLNHVAKLSKEGDIVNLSLGAYNADITNCNYPGLKNAIEKVTTINGRQQVFVTMSAGNNSGYAMLNAPGCIDAPNVFTISSINADRTCSSFANFDLPPVDYVTVGNRVFSLWENGIFMQGSGTSISSAILAGIIHARAGAPASGGTVNCMTKEYTIGVR